MIAFFTGAMGCGKSAFLIRHYEDYKEHDKCLAFKARRDSRTPGKISSRNGKWIEAIEVDSFNDILFYKSLRKNTEAIYIDEVQFIDKSGLRKLFIYAKRNKISIIAAGLDLTSELEVFETSGLFMCYAERIVKVKSKCSICNFEQATLSDCLVKKEDDILVGGDEMYIKTCDKCHSLLMK